MVETLRFDHKYKVVLYEGESNLVCVLVLVLVLVTIACLPDYQND